MCIYICIYHHSAGGLLAIVFGMVMDFPCSKRNVKPLTR